MRSQPSGHKKAGLRPLSIDSTTDEPTSEPTSADEDAEPATPARRATTYALPALACELVIDRYQYLLLMAACLVLTLPLEFVIGARVYRQPRRLLMAVLPVVAVFLIWDVIAIHRNHWTFSPKYTTGWLLPGDIPVEELAFFVVIPICGLLTYEAVRALWPGGKPDA